MNDSFKPVRDFVGYANQPPEVVWPDEARIAVNFCINYEEGGELCVLNGDDRSEVRLSDVDVKARIGGRDLNIESSYEYGSRVGYWRLLKAFDDRGLQATVNLVGLAGWQNPHALQAMIDAGFDLQPHGWRWFDYYDLDESQEREFIRNSIEQVRELTGEAPLGYYAGLPSMNTRKLVSGLQRRPALLVAGLSRAIADSLLARHQRFQIRPRRERLPAGRRILHLSQG
jgi:peptidoglycan/xylan/chitin deacetylase (PgdA/CDA1 family)